MFLPTAKRFTDTGNPTLPIPKGPNEGFDLALLEGSTAQILGRRASTKLWSNDELMNHMLSPKLNHRKHGEPRTDFSPTRKDTFKGTRLMCS